jgi:hypothetical protein
MVLLTCCKWETWGWHSKDTEDSCFLHYHTEQHCYWFLIFWRTVLEHSLTLVHEGSALSRMAPNLWHFEECTTFITLDINNTATEHNPEDLNPQDMHFLGDCFDLMTENSTPRFSWWLKWAHFNLCQKPPQARMIICQLQIVTNMHRWWFIYAWSFKCNSDNIKLTRTSTKLNIRLVHITSNYQDHNDTVCVTGSHLQPTQTAMPVQ